MTFVSDRLQAAIDKLGSPRHASGYDIGLRRGMVEALLVVEEAEKELERRIWQAWKNEGVEPR